MIKLFENFKKTDDNIKSEIVKKVNDFFKLIKKEDEEIIFTDIIGLRITIKDSNNRKFTIGFSVTFDDNLFVTKIVEKYEILSKYCVSVFSNYFDHYYNKRTENLSEYFEMEGVTLEDVDKIEFDVEDYKIFEDTNRFGL